MNFNPNDSILDIWFGGSGQRPKWRQEFDNRLWEIEKKTGLSEKELRKVADAFEELKIIRL